MKSKPTEAELLADLEKWARLSMNDSKLYLGLFEAIEALDKFRQKNQ
jgi:ribonucleotide reductase beta subunit family protein with ferritin-like domain